MDTKCAIQKCFCSELVLLSLIINTSHRKMLFFPQGTLLFYVRFGDLKKQIFCSTSDSTLLELLDMSGYDDAFYISISLCVLEVNFYLHLYLN